MSHNAHHNQLNQSRSRRGLPPYSEQEYDVLAGRFGTPQPPAPQPTVRPPTQQVQAPVSPQAPGGFRFGGGFGFLGAPGRAIDRFMNQQDVDALFRNPIGVAGGVVSQAIDPPQGLSLGARLRPSGLLQRQEARPLPVQIASELALPGVGSPGLAGRGVGLGLRGIRGIGRGLSRALDPSRGLSIPRATARPRPPTVQQGLAGAQRVDIPMAGLGSRGRGLTGQPLRVREQVTPIRAPRTRSRELQFGRGVRAQPGLPLSQPAIRREQQTFLNRLFRRFGR